MFEEGVQFIKTKVVSLNKTTELSTNEIMEVAVPL